ncbi:MAG TPA: PEP-CTERM sorting domain-containing protein [Pirellulales bacterium]|jgi:hypothetical protein|nr:PEP-CTERM sorting domain-containing protein [Pirellulales bacterium]
MLSTNRHVLAGSFRWPLVCCTVAVALIAWTSADRAVAQSFSLYDPNISSTVQTVTSAPVSDLLVPGSYAEADGVEFSNFSMTTAAFGAGVVLPTAADMVISAPNSATPELKFQGGPFLALNNQFVDVSLQFDVTALDSNQKLTTAELRYTGGTSGTGSVVFSEDVDDMSNNLLGDGSFVLQQGFSGSSNAGTIAFAGQQEIQVSKDIELFGQATGDSATLSDFTQTFNVTPAAVPEPSSIAMAIFGSAGLGWFGWRRKGKRRNAELACMATRSLLDVSSPRFARVNLIPASA